MIWASWPFRAMSDTIASSLLRKINTFHAEPPIWLIERRKMSLKRTWPKKAKPQTKKNCKHLAEPFETLEVYISLPQEAKGSHLCLEGTIPCSPTLTAWNRLALAMPQVLVLTPVSCIRCETVPKRIITAPYFGPRESFRGSENYSMLIHNAWILLDDTWHS